MADTATLKPLTSREKLDLSPDSDRDLLEQARERFALAEEAEATERSQQLDALKFPCRQSLARCASPRQHGRGH